MITPARIALALFVTGSLLLFPPALRSAKADGAGSSAAVNAIWVDYVRSHIDDAAVTGGPLGADTAPEASRGLTNMLMKNRPSRHLHMFGDDRLNLEPRRVGPLGFGFGLGGSF